MTQIDVLKVKRLAGLSRNELSYGKSSWFCLLKFTLSSLRRFEIFKSNYSRLLFESLTFLPLGRETRLLGTLVFCLKTLRSQFNAKTGLTSLNHHGSCTGNALTLY